MAASDEARLLVRIEASIRQFEKTLAQATGTADRTARRIETRFRTMERNLASFGAGLARSLVGPLAALVSAREIGQAVDAFTRIENALRVAGIEGEAMEAVFNRLFAAAQKNAAPVEALVTLYGRAALVQRELGISSEELLRFTEGVAAALRVSGKSAAESSGALLQLSQALGSGIVRAEEFNSILEGALPIAQAAARGLEEAGGSVARLRQLVIDGKVSSEAFFRAFEAGQGTLESLAATTDVTLAGAMTRLRNSLIRTVGEFDKATGASTVLANSLNTLGDAIEIVGARLSDLANAPFIRKLISEFNELDDVVTQFGIALAQGDFEKASKIAAGGFDREVVDGIQAIEEAKEAIREAEPIGPADIIAGPEIIEEADAVASRIAQAFEAAGEGVAAKTVSLQNFAAPTKKSGVTAARGGGGTGRSPESQFAEDIARIRERTEALRIEASVIGETVGEQERALAAQNLLNEAKRAGIEITPQLRREIEAEAAAYAAAVENLDLAAERFQALNDLAAEFGHQAIDAFEGLLDGTKTLNESLTDTLKMLRRMVLEAAILGEGPLAGLFGGGGGGVGGGIGGIIGSFFGGGGAGAGIGAGGIGAAAPMLAPAAARAAGFGAAQTGGHVVVEVQSGELFEARVAQVSGGVTAAAINRNNQVMTPGIVKRVGTEFGLRHPTRRLGVA